MGGQGRCIEYFSHSRFPARPIRSARSARNGPIVNVEQEVIKILRTVLSLDGSQAALTSDSPLLGSIAELDSMAVVNILTAIEERFGVVLDDDEVDGRTFGSVASLTSFVEGKLAQ